jgi:hypothetical protein
VTSGLLALAAEIALLLAVAFVAGVLLGRAARPRRGPEPDGAGTATGPAAGTADPAPAAGTVADRRAGDDAERRLWACRAEVTELRATLAELSDRKDLEMARLETAAIEALETTITAHRERITVLEKELAAAQRQFDDAREGAEEQRRRADRLAEALAERDTRISELTGD